MSAPEPLGWTSRWFPAPDSLSHFLAGIWSVDSAGSESLAARVLPDGSTSLVFQGDGTSLRVGRHATTQWQTACVSGPQTGFFDFELSASGHMLIVQLLPAGATQVLGVGMSELADRTEALDAVVGLDANRLSDFVRQAGHGRDGVNAVEHWIRDRITERPDRCAPVEAAVQLLSQRCGRLPVAEVASHVNLSRRHLGRIMKERVGVSPKLFARIARFSHALHLARTRPGSSWAHVAAEAGYADQAHMNREFADLGGIRPGDLRGASAATIW